ncbi:unnamed protein product [Somion occarium]|uniref:Uncharacterized protein n=1 Tax=Somion occarium TaxID=3059160 RepID=A0ABP1DW29_9APHY
MGVCVEDTRQRTIAHAQELLHKYEAVFSKYERRDLYAIVTGTTLRRLFINALDRLAAMDILELLRSSISEGTKGRKEIADTIAGRLSLYFPDYLGIQDQPSMTHPHASAFWHYFHVDRSSSEKHEICETAKTTIDAVVNMSQLLGTSATEARLTSELDAQPHDLPSQISLTEAIEQFVHGVRRDMEMVEHMWDRLNSG